MNKLIAFIIFLIISASSMSAEKSECDLNKVYSQENFILKGYVDGNSEGVSALIMDGKFLPIPNRYIGNAKQDGAGYSSAVHPIKNSYFGCVGGKIPKGMLEAGSTLKCEYCSHNPPFKLDKFESAKGFTLKEFKVGETKVSLIYSSHTYIQLIDNNTAIAKIWWDVLQEQ